MTWEIGLEDRGVVVTGGAGGIGREVSAAFASAGARVAVVDVDQAAADEVVAGLDSRQRHLAIAANLADLSTHEALLRGAQSEFGRFDVLAHLAAVLRRRATIDEVTEEDWDAQIDVNLKATFFLNRSAAGLFREQGRGGRIINFTSQGWWTGGFGGSVVYSASKGGIVSMSRGLARTLAPDGITVNTVSPGAVDTAMMRSGSSDDDLANFVKMIPLGRMAFPSELAGIVVFLASDHASFITGATANISGGQLMY
ncbi:MAG TPA: SDR family NAD(P)-dependent oxidoreductase [Solirubrobacteraceae bacterium]|jgi:NAD(P)-dependent dehydrogenase (short-subunit alcohol dehydrogenase family)